MSMPRQVGVSTLLNGLFPVNVTTIAFDGGFLQFGDETANVETEASIGTVLALSVSPNPVPESTTLRFGIAESGAVSLQLFYVQGRLVRTLLDADTVSAGPHSVAWDGTDNRGASAPSGIYFAHLKTQDQDSVRRITVLP